ITITPTGTAGSRSAAISVTDDAAGSPHSVNVEGTAGTPTADLNPTSLTFASKSAAPQTVTLTNNGDAPTIVTGITFNGTNPHAFTETDTCTGAILAIAPGKTCTITVSFAPPTGATGTLNATMSVASNTGTASTVTLAGSATLTLAIAPATTGGASQTVTAGS